MAMRVSQRSLFTTFIGNMNNNLSALVESNIQSSSQKQINKPSDDPVGMARVLRYRASLGDVNQYQRNLDTAKGSLALADTTLQQTSSLMNQIKGLAEQAATGTMTAENRKQVGYQLRELFGQLVNLSNAKYEDRHLFAGHKTDGSAFDQGIGVTTFDSNLSGLQFATAGAVKQTTVVRFPPANPAAPTTFTVPPAANVTFEYSEDSGTTWKTGTLAAGSSTMNVGGAQVTFPAFSAGPPATPTVTEYNPAQAAGAKNGSFLYLRPAAYYQGDDNDAPPLVDQYGTAIASTSIASQGVFANDMAVRIDSVAAGPVPKTVAYSYSSDGGQTWTAGTTTMTAGVAPSPPSPPATASEVTRLQLPGGYLEFNEAGTSTLAAGNQFMVRPHRADMGYEIMPGEFVTVNGVGKDIFGGIYNGQAMFGGDGRNLFEVVGRLVAFTEVSNQEGIQQALAELATANKVVLTEAARIGGRENRLDVAKSILEGTEDDQKARMSHIEDVDVSELMTRMSQQQLAYNSVLKSSSMIMQMNLGNYI